MEPPLNNPLKRTTVYSRVLDLRHNISHKLCNKLSLLTYSMLLYTYGIPLHNHILLLCSLDRATSFESTSIAAKHSRYWCHLLDLVSSQVRSLLVRSRKWRTAISFFLLHVSSGLISVSVFVSISARASSTLVPRMRKLPGTRIITFASHDARYAVLSQHLLAVHAAIGGILNASGCGEQIEKILHNWDLEDLDRLEKSSLFSITPQFATWNIYEDMRIVARTAAVSINVTLYGPVAKTTIPILGE